VARKLYNKLELFKDEHTVQDEVFHVSFRSTKFLEKDFEAKST
jgi:hypothetical protein